MNKINREILMMVISKMGIYVLFSNYTIRHLQSYISLLWNNIGLPVQAHGVAVGGVRPRVTKGAPERKGEKEREKEKRDGEREENKKERRKREREDKLTALP